MPLPRIARTRRGHVWGEVWRISVAVLFGAALWGSVQAQLDHRGVDPTLGKSWLLVDAAVGLACAVLLLWRRRYPRTVAWVTALASAVSMAAVGPSILALVSLSTRRRWREIAAVAVPFLAAGFVNALLYPTEDSTISVSGIVISVLILAASVASGWAIGERRAFVASLHERALTAEREQAMRVAQARVAERARIAREMHDVLAHRISLVAMHSGALAYRDDLDREEVAATAEVIRSSANQALSELRDVLGVLRDVPLPTTSDASDASDATDTSDASVPERPQPTLHDVEELVTEARAAGTDVVLEQSGEAAAVPDRVSRNAYRIVQECLTNARKHAPGRRATVTLAVARAGAGAGQVDVTVRTPAGIPAPGDRSVAGTAGMAGVAGSGLGLLGLTERAVLSGGELTYGPDRRGDFVVTARLPWAS
ncbi:sensor histidine kinase [Intrasporangium sp. YIM S08009]|uniref:sensor histidine kinase n=1 Tax=Intrasporangium zincisolvens TaxID=3080018 RepID=UPI002B058244|nr:histidine kinase [Intrasporangium sp. YIM S08009]